MSTPIVFPPIQSGVYRISSLFPDLYLELQSDHSLRASKLNRLSDAQKVRQNASVLTFRVSLQHIADSAFVVEDSPGRRWYVRDNMRPRQPRTALRDVFCA